MRTLLVILLLFAAADADAFEIRETKTPRMCVVDGKRIGCAFLVALAHKKIGTTFCELHHCPVKI